MTKPESTLRGRELGRRLRWAQERAGLNGIQLAERLGWTPTAVSRTLSGRRPTPDVDVAAFLAVCGVTGEERDRTLRLCHPDDGSDELRLSATEYWPVFLAHAATARRLTEFQPFTVPWALQTPDYTRALLDDTETAARRAALALLRLPQVTVFLYEWALRTTVGNAEVMSDQLHHLLRMSVRSELSIRVVPNGRGAYGAFTLLEFDDDPPTVYREQYAAGVLTERSNEIDACESVVGHLDRVALDEHDSRDLIGRIVVDVYSAALLEA